MKNIYIRKTATILGICIISVSIIMFVFSELTLIQYFKNNQVGSRYIYFSSFISPIQSLISGLGFGGIIILLGLMFDPAKTISLSQKVETDEPENQTEDNIS